MTIKYTGPRPEISYHGVQFKEGKEDKYVYLAIAAQILQAIDQDYSNQKSYSYDANTKKLKDKEIIDIIHTYEPNIQKEVTQEELRYEVHLKDEIANVQKRPDLKDLEKETWINNLHAMQSYRIQRAVNKIYYLHCIKNIAKIIKREKIKEIDTPFSEKYWHVLQTIEGALSEGKKSLGSNIKIEESKNSFIIKLYVNIVIENR